MDVAQHGIGCCDATGGRVGENDIAASANYTISYVSGTLTVTAATLTVTANNGTKTYGAANPSLSVR
jgi:hypothetical protein